MVCSRSGHSDRSIEADFSEEGVSPVTGDKVHGGTVAAENSKIELMDDGAAEEARRMFGVM